MRDKLWRQICYFIEFKKSLMSRDCYEKDISRLVRFVWGFKTHSREGIFDEESVIRVRELDLYCRTQGRLFLKWFDGKFILLGKLANPEGIFYRMLCLFGNYYCEKVWCFFRWELKLRICCMFDSRENLLFLLVWLKTVGDLSDESYGESD